MHLDTVCTMVDRDKVVMYPQVADTLEAYLVEDDGDGGVTVARARGVPARGGARDGDRARCASSTPAWIR